MEIDYGFDTRLDTQAGVLHCRWNHGLFSCLSTSLAGLLAAAREDRVVHEMSFLGGFEAYSAPGEDLRPRLFRTPPGPLELDPAAVDLDAAWPVGQRRGDHRAHYADLAFADYAPFVAHWFSPSAAVDAEAAEMAGGIDLDPERTVAVFYRGTDKNTEAVLADPARYARLAARLAADSGSTILIQTDQRQVRDMFARRFGDRCVWFPELPVTSGTTGMHELGAGAFGKEQVEMSRQLVAAVLLLARCRTVITHTGNGAFWLALFRGSSDALWQFDQRGVLVDPDGAVRRRDVLAFWAYRRWLNAVRSRRDRIRRGWELRRRTAARPA